MNALLASPITRGAISGLLAAAAVDIHAFLAWKKWSDAAAYDWGTASFRWVVGAATGAISAAGYGALVS